MRSGNGNLRNFYPRSPCGERRFEAYHHEYHGVISIHVPLAGNVDSQPRPALQPYYFYPRSPCGERPGPQGVSVTDAEIFLSTFPLRGTSHSHLRQRPRRHHFYPRSPCGERQGEYMKDYTELIFLSTFPLRGTSHHLRRRELFFKFLSTFPLRGTSACNCSHYSVDKFLSTFPLRGTSGGRRVCPPPYCHFYPRSPCGERPAQRVPCLRRTKISIHVPLAGNVLRWTLNNRLFSQFLSTFPLRGTSMSIPENNSGSYGISIHVPLAGNVAQQPSRAQAPRHFYPRSPCGERRQTVTDYCHLFAKVLVTVNIQFWQRG